MTSDAKPTTEECLKRLRARLPSGPGTRNAQTETTREAIRRVELHDELVATLENCWVIAQNYDPEIPDPGLPERVVALLVKAKGEGDG